MRALAVNRRRRSRIHDDQISPRLITDASGAVIALAVEVDGPDPDPIVRLPLDGLTPVMNGDDRDLQTSMTAEQLRALPAWQRP